MINLPTDVVLVQAWSERCKTVLAEADAVNKAPVFFTDEYIASLRTRLAVAQGWVQYWTSVGAA
jgi:hypothetical protein